MKFNVVLLTIIALLLTGGRVIAKDNQQKKEVMTGEEMQYYKWSTGALIGVTICGAYGEYRFMPELGLKAIGIYIFGADFNSMNRDEFIVSGIVAPVYHIFPDFPILDPVVMIGVVYSYHHWETKSIPYFGLKSGHTYREGNIHDVTFGGGFGLNFKFADRFKIGLNIWLNCDYAVSTTASLKKIKSGRILLPLPILEFTVQI
jgi:hypothetical protein